MVHRSPVRIDEQSWLYMNGKVDPNDPNNYFTAVQAGAEVSWVNNLTNKTSYLGLYMPIHAKEGPACLGLVETGNLNPNTIAQTDDPPDPEGPNMVQYVMDFDDWDKKLKGGDVVHGPSDCVIRGTDPAGNQAYYVLEAEAEYSYQMQQWTCTLFPVQIRWFAP